jgi:CheY-like chemotaxis protein
VRLNEATLLLIEDHTESLELISELLEPYFRKVIPAESAEEGLRIYRKHGPDILVSDISLPGIDGVELAERIRSTDRKIPIFWLSAFNDEYLRQEASRLDIERIFAKPLTDMEEILASLRERMQDP